jgi:3-oxoadipate enol-lactonase
MKLITLKNILLATGLIILPVVNTTAGGMSNAPILAHDVYGAGTEKVLMLHSWVDDASSFDMVKPYLNTEKYTYVFADLRGYGKSRKIKGDYTTNEISADAFRLADHLGWKKFHLIGHSMSGMAAQRMAINDWNSGKQRLKSIVVITPVTADGYPADEDTRKFLWDFIHNTEVSRQGFTGLTGGRLLPKWAEWRTDRYMKSSTADAMRGYYRMWIDEDFSEEAAAAKVGTPIRVIGGRQDLPGFQEEKYQSTFPLWYPNVDMQYITDAGHFPMYETPVYLATLVESFLDDQSKSVR